MSTEKPAKRPVGQPPMPVEQRKRNKTLRLAPETHRQLEALSVTLETTETEIVERAIREAYQHREVS